MSLTLRRLTSLAATASVALAPLSLAACGGKGEPTAPDNTPASVTVSPASAQSLVSGAKTTLTASAQTASGRSVTGVTITWTSSDAAVASVDNGVVTAAKVGVANITATAGNVASAPVQVTVTPGAAASLALRTQPGGAVSTQPLGTQPVVEVRDSVGNLVTTSTAAVTVAAAPTTTQLSGTMTVNATAGVATFTNLVLTGSDSVTLSFTASGLATATSARVGVAPPPSIALASTSVSAAAVAASSPAVQKTVAVTNGGGGTLSGLAVGTPTYGAAQPTGWLTASLSATTAPATLTLTANQGTLAAGTYTATLPITASNGANSPRSIAVTLTVTGPPASLQYGADVAKVQYVAIGGTASPTLTVLDGQSQPTATNTITFASRAPGVATVGGDSGRITGVGAGSGWVTATTGALGDSVWAIVPAANGPVLRSSLTRTWWNVGDTVVVDVVLDPRGATVGGATVLLTYPGEKFAGTGVMTYVDAPVIPGSTVSPVFTVDTSAAVIRLTFSDANGVTGTVSLARFRFVIDAATSGLSGFLYVTPQEVVAADGSSLTTSTTATRYPVIVR